jgi:hypothetical protein
MTIASSGLVQVGIRKDFQITQEQFRTLTDVPCLYAALVQNAVHCHTGLQLDVSRRAAANSVDEYNKLATILLYRAALGEIAGIATARGVVVPHPRDAVCRHIP